MVHAYGDPVAGARVLDLFAGTGALGIEAISRGAAFALFVDNGTEARALLRGNVEALGLGGVTKVFRRDAGDLGPARLPRTLPTAARGSVLVGVRLVGHWENVLSAYDPAWVTATWTILLSFQPELVRVRSPWKRSRLSTAC